MTTAFPTPAAGHTAPPCAVVIFGATGDLTKRKLMPALLNLARDGLLSQNFAVLGTSIQAMTDEEYRDYITTGVGQLDPEAVKSDLWPWLRERLYYQQGEFGKPESFQVLAERLKAIEKNHQTAGNAFFYLAVAPNFFGPVVKSLADVGLMQEDDTCFRRAIVEKPFGKDLASAVALNAELRSVLRERQLYRIDHYLGKETVQNIMVLRFANGIFEPIWNRRYIDHVQITVAETVGVEHRGGYYDKAGAMRDMVPNHMMQLLSLICMEPPISFAADTIRDEQVKVLRAVQPLEPADVPTHAVRGQYGVGGANGVFLPDYRSEPDVAKESYTETYIALKLQIDNWRWADVPFYLRTGKRMAERVSEIVIQFKKPPFVLFRNTDVNNLLPNQLVLRIQPDEGLSLRFGAKVPGTVMNLGSVKMDFSYADYFGDHPSTGYERLMYDCMLGDQTLFQRADMVEAGWGVIQPVLDLWRAVPRKIFPNYSAGSWGPPEATALLARDGREWREMSG